MSEKTIWFVTLQGKDPPVRIEFEIRQLAILGRAPTYSGTLPHVDFNPYHGLELGISLRHAAIVSSGPDLHLIDLNSTNGTWLHGRKLEAGISYRIYEGDLLRLADMEILVQEMTCRPFDSPEDGTLIIKSLSEMEDYREPEE